MNNINKILNIQESTLAEVNEFYSALQDYDYDADINVQQELWYLAQQKGEMPNFGYLFKLVVMRLLKRAIIDKAVSEVGFHSLASGLESNINFFTETNEGDEDSCTMYINGTKVRNLEEIKYNTGLLVDSLIPF